MKKTFIGYYTPSDGEFAELWNQGRIIVDANVLLAVYGVSPLTRDTLLGLLEAVKERLWIPNHFALEYQRNRIGKILEQVNHYEEAHRNLKAILEDKFRARTQHPFVSEAVDTGLESICRNLLDGKAEQEMLLTDDPHFSRTTKLFEGRVGAPYSQPELEKLYEAGRKRYIQKIPPGFMDEKKPEPERYGDYIGWQQILDFATTNSASVILVTDDAKEDWWKREGSRTFGPRVELVVEFRSCCSGLFHMYSSDRFLELSGKYIRGPIDPKAINELKERRESEPSPAARKPSADATPRSMATKPTAYSSSRDIKKSKPMLEIRKSKATDREKPEEL